MVGNDDKINYFLNCFFTQFLFAMNVSDMKRNITANHVSMECAKRAPTSSLEELKFYAFILIEYLVVTPCGQQNCHPRRVYRPAYHQLGGGHPPLHWAPRCSSHSIDGTLAWASPWTLVPLPP